MNGFLPFKSQATTSTTTGEPVSSDPPPRQAAGETPGASNAIGLLGKFSQPLSRSNTRDDMDTSNASVSFSSEAKDDSQVAATDDKAKDDNVALNPKEELNKSNHGSDESIDSAKGSQLDVFGEKTVDIQPFDAPEESGKWESLQEDVPDNDDPLVSSSVDQFEKLDVSDSKPKTQEASPPPARSESGQVHQTKSTSNKNKAKIVEDTNTSGKMELTETKDTEDVPEAATDEPSTNKPEKQVDDENQEETSEPVDNDKSSFQSEDDLYNVPETHGEDVDSKAQKVSQLPQVSRDESKENTESNDSKTTTGEQPTPSLTDNPKDEDEAESHETTDKVQTSLHRHAKDASMADFGVLTPQVSDAPPPVPPKGNIKSRRKLQPQHSKPVNIPEPSSTRASLVAPIDDLVGTSSSPALREIDIPTPSQQEEDQRPRSRGSQFDKRKPSVEIDALEQYQVSHRPFDFQIFLNHLRKKLADPLVRYIRLFLVNMSRQGHTLSASQRVKTVADFKVFINDKFGLFEPFALMDERDRENLREGLEKLIMNRLYEHCFPPEVETRHQGRLIPHQYLEDLEADKRFGEQLEKYSWVNLTHLEVSLETTKELVEFTELAVNELNKLNRYRAPRDKIICILNACKIIFSFLKANNQELNADAFIPLLILVIIQAKTPHLISNIHYIQQYRSDEWLHRGETLYYLLSLEAAMLFITNLSQSDLTIDPEEYDAHMEAWEAEQTQKVHLVQPVPQQPTENRGGQMAPSNVLLTSAEMFTKGISNFLTPSPPPSQPRDLNLEPIRPMPFDGPLPALPHGQQEQPQQVDSSELLPLLSEMFPSMDAAIITDLIHLNKGDMEACIDQCLTMTNEV